MLPNALFAQVETTWPMFGMGVVGLISQWLLWRSQQKSAKANETAITGQTAELKIAVKDEVEPIKATARTIERNTNGITERLEARTAAHSETVAILAVAIEKIRKFDPHATIIKVGEEHVAKSQAG